MASDDEPQSEWPESLPQQVRRLAAEDSGIEGSHGTTRNEQTRLYAPSSVLGGYLFLALIYHGLEDLHRSSDAIRLAWMGAMLSCQVVCGCWAAWAPIGVIWRLPSALAAAIVLALIQPRPGGEDPFILIIHGAIFVGFFVIFGLGRRAVGWRLTDGRRQGETTKEQFNLRYLFVLTALVACLMTLGRLFTGNIEAIGPNEISTRALIGMLMVMSGVFTLLQVPAAVGFLVPLLRRPRWLLLALGLPLLITGASYLTVQILISTIPVGQPILELWGTTAAMAAGATAALLIVAIVLRLGGYRLAIGKATNA